MRQLSQSLWRYRCTCRSNIHHTKRAAYYQCCMDTYTQYSVQPHVDKRLFFVSAELCDVTCACIVVYGHNADIHMYADSLTCTMLGNYPMDVASFTRLSESLGMRLVKEH